VEIPTHSDGDAFAGGAPRLRHHSIFKANLIPHGHIVRYGTCSWLKYTRRCFKSSPLLGTEERMAIVDTTSKRSLQFEGLLGKLNTSFEPYN
jgi:hypothetical protein